jgi:hypothetical protein
VGAGSVASEEVAVMGSRAAVTVNRSREEVERLWRSSELRPEYAARADVAIAFEDDLRHFKQHVEGA